MRNETFTFSSDEGTGIFVYKWFPDTSEGLKGVVQIAHGMAETAARYERFAKVLVEAGFGVYANDHRGHGKSAISVDKQGILAKSDGFNWMVKDVHKLTEIIKKENPGMPVFLFGHSMGSFVSQRYLELYGNELKGAVLSGSNGRQGVFLKVARFIAKLECNKSGRDVPSMKLNQMSFGNFNDSFKPARTEFDWLSRDHAEVDKYIADPYCGAIFPAGFFYDFLGGLIELEKPANVAQVPKDLPLYLFAGARDPVGKAGAGVKKLYETYRSHGIKSIQIKLYEDGRHEMLNELNRDEVMRDTVKWLEGVL